jgi:hypothetical protein
MDLSIPDAGSDSPAPAPAARAGGPAAAPPANYVPDMRKIARLSGGSRSDLVKAIEGADDATGLRPLRIPSERCGGDGRRATLKRKVSHISRSTAEIFAYCTSRTLSIIDAAELLSVVTNVSTVFILHKLHNMHILHILHLIVLDRRDFPPEIFLSTRWQPWHPT